MSDSFGSSVRWARAVALIAVAVALAAPVAAVDDLIEGRKVVAKSEPTSSRRRFVFRGEGAAIPGPAGVTSTLLVNEVSCDGDPVDELCVATASSGAIALDPTLWKGVGNPPGSKGFRYKDRDGTRGGVRYVSLSASGALVIKAVGDDWPLVPTGNGNGIQVRLARGNGADVRYCADFGGVERRNQAGALIYKNADAPPSCGGACGNGLVENGEGCDPPDGVNCDASCRLTCGADPGSTLIDCSLADDPTLDLAGAGDTFLLAFAQAGPEGSRARGVRFDSGGQPADTPPLLLSDGVTSASEALAVADDAGFHALWLSDGSAFGKRRGVPFSGPALGAIETAATQIGQGPSVCLQITYSGPFGLGASLTSGPPHAVWAGHSPCVADWLVNVPDAGWFFDGPDFVVDLPPASFARADSAVAAVWLRRVTHEDASQSYGIVAKQIEPMPVPVAVEITPLAGSIAPPVVAATGDLFMVVWTTATEVRGLRFTLPGTALDGAGGFLIASLSGAPGLADVTSDGTRFAVAWRNRTPGDDELRAVHVDTDGQVVEPTPLLLASADSIEDLAIAAGDSAAWAAFSTEEPSGAFAMRIVAVP